MTLILAVLLGLFLLTNSSVGGHAKLASMSVYVGTVTQGGSRGIYLYKLDLATGQLTEGNLAAEAINPGFVALHPRRPLLYALDQMSLEDGRLIGAVSSFLIDEESGQLTRLNQQPSGGAGPCHVAIDGTGQTVLVANYGGGSVSSYPVEVDGRLGRAASLIQHVGSGPHPGRQRGPHAHSVTVDAASRFAFVADLGIDQVRVYRLDPETALLEAHEAPAVELAPGAGPRHFAFHPSGQSAYTINELDNTITTFAYDPESGTLEERQTVRTLPSGFTGANTTAEILVHPSGKYIYGSNRGHDSIVAFAVANDGTLTLIGHYSSQGKHPRNFGIDPTGRVLIVANRDSDNLVPFLVDPASGKLTPTGQTYTLSMPVCVRFR
jgi:6-phosphogluconolactonase